MVLPLLVLLGASVSWARPLSAPQEREALAPATREWIPVELFLGSYPYLRGTLNGVETEMVLDSGAGLSVVDAGLARRLGLASAGGQAAEGFDGAQGARFVESVELALGAARLTLPRMLELDVGGAHSRLGREVPVLLGRELFERFVVDLDYPNRRLALREPADFAYRGPGRTLPLLAGEPGQLVVEASVEDLPPARFGLDTGSRGLALLADFTRRHALLAERVPVSRAPSDGPGGGSFVRTATLRSFTLAGHRFTNVPASFAEERAGPADEGALAGSLGAEILTRFRVVFDVSRARVHLEPADDWETRPFRRDRIGLAAVLRGESLEVTFVAPGSPAEAQGWRAGERILAVNGQPVTPAGWSASLARCLESPAGAEVTLTDGAGVVRRLVAADYH